MAINRDVILLTFLGLLAFLPGLASLPVVDRDEARYAQSAVQMIETGDYIDIRFQDEPRYKKPVGAYWTQVAAIFATGQADDVRRGERPIWAQRLPSVLGALVAVWATYFAGRVLFGRREALVGAALLAASVSLVFEAHQAKTDALLVGACAVALYGLVKGRAWPFWLAVGVGVLVKGPVIVGVLGLAVASLLTLQQLRPPPPAGEVSTEPTEGGTPSSTHSPAHVPKASFLPPPLRGTSPVNGGGRTELKPLLRPLPILVTLALVLPWFVAIGTISDGAFYSEALGRDFGAKLGSAQESHGGPPGYYLLTTLVMWWPGVVALPVAALWSWRERRTPAVALLLCWLVPMWIMLEFVPTKLPHYTLPLYPALALLCGAALVRAWGGRSRWVGVGLFTLSGIALAAIASFGIVMFAINDFGWLPLIVHTNTALPALLCATALGVALYLARNRNWPGFALASAVPLALGLSWTLPRDLLWIAPQIVERAEGRRVVSPDFREPSLVYLAGTDTRLDLDDVRPGDLLVWEGDVMSRTPPDCATGRNWRTAGVNYADGRLGGWLIAYETDACDPASLERWRAEQAARAMGDGG